MKRAMMIGLSISLLSCWLGGRPAMGAAAAAAPGDARPWGEWGLRLWYDRPATRWEEAVPIGNGRLGAMVFGGTFEERLQLNEETVWAGPPCPAPRAGIRRAMAEAREAWFAGDFATAHETLQAALPPRITPRSYQTLGDLHLTLTAEGELEAYRRWLDLETGLAVTRFALGGVTFTREALASAPDQVLVVRQTADRPEAVAMRVRLDRPKDFQVETVGQDTLDLFGQAQHDGEHLGVRWRARLTVRAEGGSVRAADESLEVRGADAVTLYLTAATDYNRADPAAPLDRDLAAACQRVLQRALAKPYAELRAGHVEDHQRLFRRCILDLGGWEAAASPTDRRVKAVADGASDPALTTLYFQFGRYLLISSSRPGDLPANLQGIWNEHLNAPWHADYHLNINIQMNYWPAEVTNLSPCHEPLFAFVEGLVPGGRRTANVAYGCRGFVAHHATDVWRWNTPFGKLQWGMWPHGGGWCAQHFMEHYRFTQDETFLQRRAYPLLRAASRFYLDYLTPHPRTGRLVSGLDNSPENMYLGPDGKRYSVSMGPSMSQQIIWETLTGTLEAARALGDEDALTAEIRGALAKLALPRVGPDGRLLEWAEPFAEVDPHHRHVSHLFGLHPGRLYTRDRNPEMLEACRKVLERRGFGGDVGWSNAWKTSFYARLFDENQAHWFLQRLIGRNAFPNLLNACWPGRVFQIDGNFGGAAGVAEMLIQSHTGEIVLLPALPKAWPSGRAVGLCARGGWEVELAWRHHRLEQAVLRARSDAAAVVRYGDQRVRLNSPAGQSRRILVDASGRLHLASRRAAPSAGPAPGVWGLTQRGGAIE